jgi:GH24 family phage-related lysozyme (muramidase)
VTVNQGQTLSEIAYENGVDLKSIETANPSITNPNSIDVGQTINVPAGGANVITGFKSPLQASQFFWNNFGATDSNLENSLISVEGYKTDTYYDSVGKLTVGIGHLVVPSDNLSFGDSISPLRVEQLFQQDAPAAYNTAASQAAEAGITDPNFTIILTSVNYQLVTGWTTTFSKTWAQIVNGNYETAAEMFDGTKWQQQTPARVAAFQNALRSLPPKP